MAKVLPVAIILLFVSLKIPGRAGGAEEPFQPPVAGKPDRFNGAVGVFKITTRAESKTVQVEKPLLFTVRVTATGKVLTPPSRPALPDPPSKPTPISPPTSTSRSRFQLPRNTPTPVPGSFTTC
jgi:hypothetical protein